jgi:hypothetical protein
MASSTVRVFSSDQAWEVKSEGAKGHIYPTQREAIAAAPLRWNNRGRCAALPGALLHWLKIAR